MNYFLIDFENVKADGIKDLQDVCEGDAIIVFYSEQCKSITLDVLENILRLHLQYSSYKVKVGTKNALDFQLSSYLGYLIGQNGQRAQYHIISNDKGYDCLCEYWKDQGVSVERKLFNAEKPQKGSEKTIKKGVSKTSTKSAVKTTKPKISENNLATLEEISEFLLPEDEPETVLGIFNQYKTKQAICNGMSKKFKDSKRASAVYKKLRPLLKNKNKS